MDTERKEQTEREELQEREETVPAQHYLVSWYTDILHEYGFNTVDEYCVRLSDLKDGKDAGQKTDNRVLLININRMTDEQHSFFGEEARVEYSISFRERVIAPTRTVQLPRSLVEQCYRIAKLREELETLTKGLKIPKADPGPPVMDRLTEAMDAFKDGRYAEAAQIYEDILYREPGRVESTYNLACAEARQGHTESAQKSLEALVTLNFDNILQLINDPDLDGVVTEPIVRRMYTKTIMNHFQCRYGNKINLERYNSIFRTSFTDTELQKLSLYDINPLEAYDFMKGLQARLE